jgi:uncharacterized repeat protein (TIGR01451 family)
MKNIILLFLVFTTSFLSAQNYVTIPDANFRAFLIQEYPSCFNASEQMDTTCVDILNATMINCSNILIRDLNGIQYFDNLTTLICTDMGGGVGGSIIMPSLPASLIHFDCSFNGIGQLPILPNTLSILKCTNSYFSGLPSNLPSSLTVLECGNNGLSSLPTLPNTLTRLVCGNDGGAGHNLLMTLPPLPNSLVHLDIQNNMVGGLVPLPTLPNSLTYLNCAGSEYNKLPFPLPTSLTYLNCDHIKTYDGTPVLRSLPSRLTYLSAYDCRLTALPSLPSTLTTLILHVNGDLHCLPFLPNGLDSLVLPPNITCLPNIPSGITTTLPICPVSAVTCSEPAWAIGKVYLDGNTNGAYDLNEQLLDDFVISNTTRNYNSISYNHSYLIQVDSSDTTSIVLNNPYSTAWNSTPATHTFIVTSNGQVPGSYDFGLQAVGTVHNLSVNIATQRASPGFRTLASATFKNTGNQIENNVAVKMIIPNGWSYDSSFPAGGVYANGEVTWSGVSLALFESKTFTVFSTLPTTTPLGTAFSYIASADNGINPPFQGSYSDVVIGSYDPNDKTVSKKVLPSNYIASEEEIIYTIRFQNTGTASAINVKIFDQISENLDIRTLRVVNASHAYDAKIHQDRFVEIDFPNINLIDSFANEPQSHGFVQIAIKPIAGLASGTDIQNQAAIYFDFNQPIFTNTEHTLISCFTAYISGPPNLAACENAATTLTANASGSTNPVYAYHWNNGQTTAQINPVITHPEVFIITVSDGSNCPNVVRNVILNPIDAPEVRFANYMPAVIPPFTMFVTNNTDLTNKTCRWDFGDGSFSNNAFPTHVYAQTGLYNLCLTVTDNITGCATTHCDTMGIDSIGNIWRQGFTLNIINPATVGIDPIAHNTLLVSVSPNPNHGVFQLNLDLKIASDINIELLDITGKLVYEKLVPHLLQGKSNIPVLLENVAQGVYLARVTSAGSSSTIKVVVN